MLWSARARWASPHSARLCNTLYAKNLLGWLRLGWLKIP